MPPTAADHAKDLLAELLVLAGRGLQLLALGVAILIAGIVAVVSTALGHLLRLLGQLLRAIIPYLRMAVQVLTRLGCATAAAVGIGWAMPRLWLAYGADLPAAIPAALFTLGPALAILLPPLLNPKPASGDADPEQSPPSPVWTALLAVGAVTAAVGCVVPLLPPVFRILLIAVLLLAGITAIHIRNLPTTPPTGDATP